MQFGIFVFVEAQEKNVRGNLQGSKCDRDCIFMKTFFVLWKGSFPLSTLQVFFEIFLPQPPVMFSTDLH